MYDDDSDNEDFSDLIIVLPTLNERIGIERVLEEFREQRISFSKIIVVDGHSTDGTIEYAQSRGVRVILQEGRGKSDAIRTLVETLERENINPKYVLFMDADYTYPAKHIRDLLRKIRERHDLVIGARRYLEKGSQSALYRLGNKILTKIFNILFGTRLSDVLSGMYVVRFDILRELLFESRDFGIESEIVAHIVSTGGSVSEVPIEYRRRSDPKSKKLKIIGGVKILADMIRLAWSYNPTFLIFAGGSLLLVPGLILGAYVGYHYLFTGIVYHVKGLIAIVSSLAGFQSLLLALLSLYLKRSEIRIMREIRKLRAWRD
ncbi:MAG: glycosyltransferase family 2 protein [Sulfolobales archaeon]